MTTTAHKDRVTGRGRFLAAAVAVLAAWSSAALGAQAPTTPPASFSTAPAALPMFRSDQISLLMQTLGDVESQGFQPDEFTPPSLDPLLRSPNAQDRLRGAAMLKTAILAYARAQHGGRLPSSAFDKNWGMRPTPYNAEAEFDTAFADDRLAQWLDTLAPPFDRYAGLSKALVQYRAIAEKGGWTAIDSGPSLGVGAHGARVIALRQRLAAEDPQSAPDADTANPTFDQSLAEAVQHFQHNVGVEPTGVVDKATLAALNVPIERRILQLQANMERWRWAPRIWPATRIEANIPASEMDAFQDNAIVLEMRAAPGRPDDQTPILSSQVESVVFDPPWNVPSSIATKELWPKEHAHPGYLESHGYRLIGDGEGKRIQQKFGPKSALGQMKFDFPNNYSVYLHDTPSRAAFSRTSRAVSHGCVRLQRPKELANLLFQNDAKWTPDHIDEVIADGDTVRAPLAKPVPIFLMYWTAFPDVKGRINFRDDVYDWDADLMGRIAASRDRGWQSAVQ